MTSPKPQTTNIELKSLSALLLTLSLTILVIFLLNPINTLFTFLVFPIIIISFIIVNWLSKIISNNGWLLIGTGVITLALILTTILFYDSPYKQITELQQQGYYFTYSGENHLTEEQFRTILQYYECDTYTIEVSQVKPLTVKYDFVSSSDYPFLNKLNRDGFPQSLPTYSNSILFVFLVIPIFLIILGFNLLNYKSTIIASSGYSAS